MTKETRAVWVYCTPRRRDAVRSGVEAEHHVAFSAARRRACTWNRPRLSQRTGRLINPVIGPESSAQGERYLYLKLCGYSSWKYAAPSLLTDGSKGYAASVALPSSGKMKALLIRQTAQTVRYGPVNMREGREERSAMEEEGPGRVTLITSKCCYDQRTNPHTRICNSDQSCC